MIKQVGWLNRNGNLAGSLSFNRKPYNDFTLKNYYRASWYNDINWQGHSFIKRLKLRLKHTRQPPIQNSYDWVSTAAKSRMQRSYLCIEVLPSHSTLHYSLPFICQENERGNKYLQVDLQEKYEMPFLCVHLCLIQISNCPWNVHDCVLRLSGNTEWE